MKKEQPLMLAALEEDDRKRLGEETLTELELTEDVLEASQSLRDELSELSAHSQGVKSVRLINWVSDSSTEVKNQLTHVQGCKVETERRSSQDRLQPCFISAGVPLTGIPSKVATEITPPFVIVPDTTNLIQPSLNNAQYSVQLNATT